MRTHPWTASAVVALVWAGTAMSGQRAAAPADAEILLNRRWAEQAFAEKPACAQPANRLVIVHEDVPGDTKLGRCAAVTAPPMKLGDKAYEHGIGVNSLSVIRVILERPAKRFTAVIGVDRNMDNSPASVRFHPGQRPYPRSGPGSHDAQTIGRRPGQGRQRRLLRPGARQRDSGRTATVM